MKFSLLFCFQAFFRHPRLQLWLQHCNMKQRITQEEPRDVALKSALKSSHHYFFFTSSSVIVAQRFKPAPQLVETMSCMMGTLDIFPTYVAHFETEAPLHAASKRCFAFRMAAEITAGSSCRRLQA